MHVHAKIVINCMSHSLSHGYFSCTLCLAYVALYLFLLISNRTELGYSTCFCPESKHRKPAGKSLGVLLDSFGILKSVFPLWES